MRSFLISVLTLMWAPLAIADCREDFENKSTAERWDFGVPTFEILSSGGVTNNGSFFKVTKLDTFFPYVNLTGLRSESCFLGNFRDRHVTEVGASMKIDYTDYAQEMGSSPLAIGLWSHNGTPQNFEDDYGYVFVSTNEMSATSGEWASFVFQIPTDASAWPEGWDYIMRGQESNASGPAPQEFFSQIDEIGFYVGNPLEFTILRRWELGFDEVYIKTAEPNE